MAGIYRTVEVSIWQDIWFEELGPHAKLLFFYLLTNTRQTACGAFAVSLRSMCHETGLDADQVRAAMTELVTAKKAVWWPETGWVFLVRFFKRQRALSSDRYTIAGRKATAELPADVREEVERVYPELVGSPVASANPPDTPSRANQKQNQRTESETESAAGVSYDQTQATPAPEPATTQPQRATARVVVAAAPLLVSAMCDELGADEATLPPSYKRRQAKIASRLVADGIDEVLVRRHLRFLRSQHWRTAPIDLATVESDIGKWRLAGCPETESAPARASPKGATKQQVIQRGVALSAARHLARTTANGTAPTEEPTDEHRSPHGIAAEYLAPSGR